MPCLTRLLRLIAILAITSQSAYANPSLPLEVQRALEMVPLDSESLLGTLKPFTVPKPVPQSGAIVPLDDLLRLSMVGGVATSKFGHYLGAMEGAEVSWALFAKRAQEVNTRAGSRIIELGMHPYESVSIAKFRERIPPRLLEAVKSTMRSELRNGIDVFRSTTEPIALALVGPDLLVTVSMLSSSEAMLDDVIDRIKNRQSARLFGDAADAWALTNLDSTYWGLRKTTARERQYPETRGRDWVLFSYDRESPRSARFRSVLNGEPLSASNRWAGPPDSEVTLDDMGFVARTTVSPRHIDTVLTCLPEQKDRCLALPVFIDALGIMIWI